MPHRPCLGIFLIAVIAEITLLAACGGGGTSPTEGQTGSSTTPVATSDFSILVTPQQITIPPGAAASLTISITPTNNFTGQVSIAITGAPTGVSVAPLDLSIAAGSQQQLTLNASSAVVVSVGTLTITGTANSLSHTTTAGVFVSSVQPTASHAPIRTRYLRTDAYGAGAVAPPHLTVYSPAQRRFFVSNPSLNRIDIFDAALEVEIGQIVVPGAWGIDITPDGTTLYAGTLVGDLYAIDPSAMKVLQRIPGATIGPNGYFASEAFVLADGRLALLGAPGGLPADGYQSFALWNPADNSILHPGSCVQNIGAFTVSGDRKEILLGSIDSDGTVCSYNPTTQQFATGGLGGGFLREIIPSPDGSRFFVTTNQQGVAVFNTQTVQLEGQINPNPNSSNIALPNAAMGAVISLDGKTLYLADDLFEAIGAFDTTSLSQTGWIPSFQVYDGQPGAVISAIDETGLIVGPIGHGVAFIDASQALPAEPTQIAFGNATPPTGPIGGGTATSVVAQSSSPVTQAPLSQVFVGGALGTNASFNFSRPASIDLTTPVSAEPGAADFTFMFSDHGLSIAPEGFSYGPTIVEISPNASPANGGSTAVIFGYGFSSLLTGTQVTIGGNRAPVTGVSTFASPSVPYPFQMEALAVLVPAGSPGTSADVTITTDSGSTTSMGAFHYSPAVTFYPLAATLQQGIYDRTRSTLFFTDRAQIQRFSLATHTWLTPIAIPNVNSSTQLIALALSPDASKLVVSDGGNANIFVLNPDSPSPAQIFPVQKTQFEASEGIEPCGVSITNAGVIYFATFETGGDGAPAFHKMDTSGNITDLGFNIFDVGGDLGPDQDIRVLMSSDGSRVYLNESDNTSDLLTANDSIVDGLRVSFGEGPNEMALSGDGTRLVTGDYLADENMNPLAAVSYVDRDTWFFSSVYGQKLNNDGSLLFQPLTDAIDVINGNTGLLESRVALPLTIANVYDGLVVDDTDQLLFAITSAGIAQIDLSSLNLSPSDRMSAFHVSEKSGPSRALLQSIGPNVKPGYLSRPKPLSRAKANATRGPLNLSQ
jgi:hypothetical protein